MAIVSGPSRSTDIEHDLCLLDTDDGPQANLQETRRLAGDTMGSDMEAPHNDIEAARLSLSDSSSRLARAERVFRSAELMKNTFIGRFFSAASARTRLDRAFAALAAAVAGFQHSYHEMKECCSSQGIDFKEYVSNYELLNATLRDQEDYLAVDSEGTLWTLLERSSTLRSK